LKLYSHFQVGGGDEFHLDATTLNFRNTNQRELGLEGMRVGEQRTANLFNAGINSNSLGLGRVLVTLEQNGQFSIANNRFNFDFNNGGSLSRDAGTLLAAGVNYNVIQAAMYPSLALPLIAVPLIFGGPFDVVYQGTVVIPR
jgi:hypothetical protein